MINKENYEVYFIDYLDDKLDELTVAKLRLFLELHPELKEELAGMEEIRLVPERSALNSLKEQLKRDDNGLTSVDCKMIAALENDLPENDKREFLLEVAANTRLSATWKLYSETVLIADEKLIYNEKESLKRPVVRPLVLQKIIRYSAIAAVLLLGIYFALDSKEDVILSENQLVSTSASVVEGRKKSVVSVLSPQAENKSVVSLKNKNPKLAQAIELQPVADFNTVSATNFDSSLLAADTSSLAGVESVPVPEEIFTDGELSELIALMQAQVETVKVERRTLLHRIFGVRTTRSETVIDDCVVFTLEAGPLSARHVKTFR